MLYYALVFFIIALIAGAFGFFGIAAGAVEHCEDFVLRVHRAVSGQPADRNAAAWHDLTKWMGVEEETEEKTDVAACIVVFGD